jgi:signal peptidase I
MAKRGNRKSKQQKVKDPPARKKRSGFRENVQTIGVAIIIALLIRAFLVQAFRIPSGSMEDSLLIGDYLLVDKITYGAKIPGTNWRLPGFREPARGDIIVFKDPHTNRDFIKRCIAVGGETIEVADNEVRIDGHPLEEPYKCLKPPVSPGILTDFGPYRVGPDSLFMMGDNRNHSEDSRYWGVHPSQRYRVRPGGGRTGMALARDRVVGRAFILYWSSDTETGPKWLQSLSSESALRGFLEMFLCRPRLRRLGTWLAKDYSDVYEAGVAEAAAPGAGAPDAGAPDAEPIEPAAAAAPADGAGAGNP